MIIKVSTHVSTRSTKHVNIQAHENLNLKVHIYHTVQLPQDVCAREFNNLNVSIYKRIHILSIKCVHMWFKNKSHLGVTRNLYIAFKHERIRALDQDSIQLYDHQSIKHMRIQEPKYTYLKSTNHHGIQAISSKYLCVRKSNYRITQASKPIQILASMCVDIIQVNIYGCAKAIVKAFECKSI